MAAAIAAAVTAVFVVIGIRAGSNVSDGTLTIAFGAGFSTLALLFCYGVYLKAFTKCTPAGIRTRGFRNRKCSWSEVRNISLQEDSNPNATNYSVMVTTTGRKRFRLGVPVDGWLMPDPQFTIKLQQIQDYWHSTAQPPKRIAPD
jgi:hypothetical protein